MVPQLFIITQSKILLDKKKKIYSEFIINLQSIKYRDYSNANFRHIKAIFRDIINNKLCQIIKYL